MNVGTWATTSTTSGANFVVTMSTPPPDDTGTAGVREPRRPLPVGPPPAQVHREICN